VRRAVAGLLASCVALIAMAPAGAPPAAAAGAGRVVCTVTDHRVIGLSGLIVTGTGFIGISDSNIDKSKIRIWYLNRACHVVRSIGYPTPAYDPEDVALGRDGTLYVADIGDNDSQRSSIAIWKLRPGSDRPEIFRYRYPDRAHDAEAILLDAHDSPIVVTKDPGAGEIFTSGGPPDPTGHPVPLRRVGTFDPTPTGTPNGLGILGALVVTGGANSPDRRLVALRTYADAYVWRVVDDDVVATLTRTRPVRIPLPGEPQGESIAFDATGTHIYTVSDRETQPVRTPILEYPLPASVTSGAGASSGAGAATGPSSGSGAAGAGVAGPGSAGARTVRSAGHGGAARSSDAAGTGMSALFYGLVAGGALLVIVVAVGLAIRRRPR